MTILAQPQQQARQAALQRRSSTPVVIVSTCEMEEALSKGYRL